MIDWIAEHLTDGGSPRADFSPPKGAELSPAKGTEFEWLQKEHINLSASEYEILLDIAAGLTDKGIALRRNMCIRSVQNRNTMLYAKIVHPNPIFAQCSPNSNLINYRVRLIIESVRCGILDDELLKLGDSKLLHFLNGGADLC